MSETLGVSINRSAVEKEIAEDKRQIKHARREGQRSRQALRDLKRTLDEIRGRGKPRA